MWLTKENHSTLWVKQEVLHRTTNSIVNKPRGATVEFPAFNDTAKEIRGEKENTWGGVVWLSVRSKTDPSP